MTNIWSKRDRYCPIQDFISPNIYKKLDKKYCGNNGIRFKEEKNLYSHCGEMREFTLIKQKENYIIKSKTC